jgi:hypothetical protein
MRQNRQIGRRALEQERFRNGESGRPESARGQEPSGRRRQSRPDHSTRCAGELQPAVLSASPQRLHTTPPPANHEGSSDQHHERSNNCIQRRHLGCGNTEGSRNQNTNGDRTQEPQRNGDGPASTDSKARWHHDNPGTHVQRRRSETTRDYSVDLDQRRTRCKNKHAAPEPLDSARHRPHSFDRLPTLPSPGDDRNTNLRIGGADRAMGLWSDTSGTPTSQPNMQSST